MEQQQKKSYQSSIEVLIDFINSVIAVQVFLQLITFFTSAFNT